MDARTEVGNLQSCQNFDCCLIRKNLFIYTVFLYKQPSCKWYTDADLKICQFLHLHMKIIC